MTIEQKAQQCARQDKAHYARDARAKGGRPGDLVALSESVAMSLGYSMDTPEWNDFCACYRKVWTA